MTKLVILFQKKKKKKKNVVGIGSFRVILDAFTVVLSEGR